MRIRRFQVAWLAVGLAGGCANHRTVTLSDRDNTMPALRADVGFGRGPDSRFGLAAEATGAEGEPSPTSDFDLLSVQLMARYRLLDTREFDARAFAGLEFVDFDAAESAGAQAFRRSRSAVGPVVGLDVGWLAIEPIEIYGRGTIGALVEATSSIRGELGLRTELSTHTQLFVGYRWWEVEQEDLDLLTLSSPQELDLEVEGLVIGMGVRF